MLHQFKTLDEAQKYTESLLALHHPPAPTPTGDFATDRQAQIVYNTTVANLNNRSPELAGFWKTMDGQTLKAEVIQKTIDAINTPELLAWWEDFNARVPRS